MVCKDREQTYWFAMRDIGRSHSKLPAYKYLSESGFEVFTPMRQQIKTSNGHRIRVEVPVIFDLLFVRSTRTVLDPLVNKTKNLRYRYLKGGRLEPIVISDVEMQNFIEVATSSNDVKYYAPEEITPDMYGRKVRILSGTLKDKEGYLLASRGNSKKRFIVELPGLLSACAVVEKEFITLV